jgi:hypothetical protein
MAPSGHRLLAVLESAARRVHDVPPGWHLLDVGAEPIRYKPGDRCVIRYRMGFGDPMAAGAAGAVTLGRAPWWRSSTRRCTRRRPPTTS